MKRQTLLIGALAATAALTAYVAQNDEADAPAAVGAITHPRRSAQPTPAPAPTAPTPAGRGPWPAPDAQAVAAWSAPAPPPPPPAPPPAPPAPPAPPPPPPPPPAFPYQWIGSLTDQASATALLAGPQRSLGAHAGDVLDGQWRVERVEPQQLTLTWLATGATVSLNAQTGRAAVVAEAPPPEPSAEPALAQAPAPRAPRRR